MIERNVTQLFKSCDLFASLEPEALESIGGLGVFSELGANEVLFKQGDPSDCIYLVIDGLLQAIVVEVDGTQRPIGEIGKGQIFGELGALSGAPRSLTISALTSCQLFRLEKEIFSKLCHQYAEIPLAMLKPIISRSQSTIQLLSKKKSTRRVLIIPANTQTSVRPFIEAMRAKAAASDLLTVVYESEVSSSLASQEELAGGAVISVAQHDGSKWAHYQAVQTQTIFVVAQQADQVDFSGLACQALFKSEELKGRRKDLVLLHDNQVKAPFIGTDLWLKEAGFHMVHHASIENDADLQRMKRFVLGRPIGLVLGGGGAKGWAHMGVLKCLADNQVPFDAICGTSIGGIVAGCVALSTSYEQLFSLFDVLSTEVISRLSYTLPTISIFSAKASTESLQRVFGETEIADLGLPFFVVSCNLLKRTEAIHKQGKTWKLLRATASLPGLAPPVLFDGELHVDGGLINNVPVFAMKNWLGEGAKIIAVDIGAAGKITSTFNFPPILTFWQLLLRKLKIRNQEFRIPKLFETFWQSLLVGSAANAQKQLKTADIIIAPDVTRYTLLDEKPATRQKLVELGYQTTQEQLKKISNLTDWN